MKLTSVFSSGQKKPLHFKFVATKFECNLPKEKQNFNVEPTKITSLLTFISHA